MRPKDMIELAIEGDVADHFALAADTKFHIDQMDSFPNMVAAPAACTAQARMVGMWTGSLSGS